MWPPAWSAPAAATKHDAARNGRGKSDENRFEQESRAFFGRVRSAYLAIAAREPQRVVLVDARGTARGDPREDRGDCAAKAEAGGEDGVSSVSSAVEQLAVAQLGNLAISNLAQRLILLDSKHPDWQRNAKCQLLSADLLLR